MLVLTPLYADVIMIKWRKTANATSLASSGKQADGDDVGGDPNGYLIRQAS